jgi:hypothetical protein
MAVDFCQNYKSVLFSLAQGLRLFDETVGVFRQRQFSQIMLVCTQASALYFLEQLSMSKRTLIFQSAGSLLGLVCLNLALAPIASAGDSSTNMSHGTGSNMSHGTGGNCGKDGCGYNMSHGTGGNMSHGTGSGPQECKPCKPGQDPFTNESHASGENEPQAGTYVIGKNTFAQFPDGNGKGIGGYSASSVGLSQQLQQLLNAAESAYAQASARVAEIQSRSTPSAQKDTSTRRFSRVADANIADCGCNATASEPASSAELAAAKAAEAEAAASLKKAQEQARKFLESTKNSVAFGSVGPIW